MTQALVRTADTQSRHSDADASPDTTPGEAASRQPSESRSRVARRPRAADDAPIAVSRRPHYSRMTCYLDDAVISMLKAMAHTRITGDPRRGDRHAHNVSRLLAEIIEQEVKPSYIKYGSYIPTATRLAWEEEGIELPARLDVDVPLLGSFEDAAASVPAPVAPPPRNPLPTLPRRRLTH